MRETCPLVGLGGAQLKAQWKESLMMRKISQSVPGSCQAMPRHASRHQRNIEMPTSEEHELIVCTQVIQRVFPPGEETAWAGIAVPGIASSAISGRRCWQGALGSCCSKKGLGRTLCQPSCTNTCRQPFGGKGGEWQQHKLDFACKGK